MQPGKIFWASWINIFVTLQFVSEQQYHLLVGDLTQLVHLWICLTLSNMTIYMFSKNIKLWRFCGGVLVNVFKPSLDVFESSGLYQLWGSGEVILFAKIFYWSDVELFSDWEGLFLLEHFKIQGYTLSLASSWARFKMSDILEKMFWLRIWLFTWQNRQSYTWNIS